MKVQKCIGFDSTEDHRTFATSGGVAVCADPDLPSYADRYVMRYPLREWGLDREACGRIIVAAGLPLPPKSACFFCPSMKDAEIAQLAQDDPVLYRLALAMEERYRAGRHFRGDDAYTVKAVRQGTREKVSLDLRGPDVATVRAQFRQLYNDTAKPYRYKVRISKATVGLGRSETWESKRMPLQLADVDNRTMTQSYLFPIAV